MPSLCLSTGLAPFGDQGACTIGPWMSEASVTGTVLVHFPWMQALGGAKFPAPVVTWVVILGNLVENGEERWGREETQQRMPHEANHHL